MIFYNLSRQMFQVAESVFVKSENSFTTHSQYHGCWWAGDTRIQGISKHSIDPAYHTIPVSASAELIKIGIGYA